MNHPVLLWELLLFMLIRDVVVGLIHAIARRKTERCTRP
jgi:hypothetical protein